MDDQQGITGKIIDAIKDKLVRKSNWGKWIGTAIVLDIMVIWNHSYFKDKEMKGMDVVSAALIILLIVLLGIKSTETTTVILPPASPPPDLPPPGS